MCQSLSQLQRFLKDFQHTQVLQVLATVATFIFTCDFFVMATKCWLSNQAIDRDTQRLNAVLNVHLKFSDVRLTFSIILFFMCRLVCCGVVSCCCPKRLDWYVLWWLWCAFKMIMIMMIMIIVITILDLISNLYYLLEVNSV